MWPIASFSTLAIWMLVVSGTVVLYVMEFCKSLLPFTYYLVHSTTFSVALIWKMHSICNECSFRKKMMSPPVDSPWSRYLMKIGFWAWIYFENCDTWIKYKVITRNALKYLEIGNSDWSIKNVPAFKSKICNSWTISAYIYKLLIITVFITSF